MSYWADHGNIAHERLPTGNGSMILKLARPLTVKMREQDGETGSLSDHRLSGYLFGGRGFHLFDGDVTCADEGEVETLFDEIDGRADCVYGFSSEGELEGEMHDPAATRKLFHANHDDTPRRQRPKGRPRACAAVRCVIAVLAARVSI